MYNSQYLKISKKFGKAIVFLQFSEHFKLSKTSNTQLTPLRSIWGYRPYTSKTYLLYLLILFFITALRSLFVVGQRNAYIKWNSICFLYNFYNNFKIPSNSFKTWNNYYFYLSWKMYTNFVISVGIRIYSRFLNNFFNFSFFFNLLVNFKFVF